MSEQTKKTLTARQQAEYVAGHGLHCPFCGSESEITGGMFQSDEGGAWQEVTCNACGECWDDTYTLTGIVPGKHGEWESEA